jgi:hypothetical protein
LRRSPRTSSSTSRGSRVTDSASRPCPGRSPREMRVLGTVAYLARSPGRSADPVRRVLPRARVEMVAGRLPFRAPRRRPRRPAIGSRPHRFGHSPWTPRQTSRPCLPAPRDISADRYQTAGEFGAALGTCRFGGRRGGCRRAIVTPVLHRGTRPGSAASLHRRHRRLGLPHRRGSRRSAQLGPASGGGVPSRDNENGGGAQTPTGTATVRRRPTARHPTPTREPSATATPPQRRPATAPHRPPPPARPAPSRRRPPRQPLRLPHRPRRRNSRSCRACLRFRPSRDRGANPRQSGVC